MGFDPNCPRSGAGTANDKSICRGGEAGEALSPAFHFAAYSKGGKNIPDKRDPDKLKTVLVPRGLQSNTGPFCVCNGLTTVQHLNLGDINILKGA